MRPAPLPLALAAALLSGGVATADDAAIAAFAEHCFSPRLTAETAAELLPARHRFHDVAPWAGGPVSPGEVAPGTDRLCEVAFDGDRAEAAAAAVAAALEREGIVDAAPLPERYAETEGTALLAARFLNPRRVAVVHVGTRAGADGTETFMLVERQVRQKPRS